VPFADFVLFKSSTQSRVLLNIGGVANLTFIPAGGTMDDVIAFDTGPGNCVSDFLCRQSEPTGPGYDKNGAQRRQRQGRPRVRDRVLRPRIFSPGASQEHRRADDDRHLSNSPSDGRRHIPDRRPAREPRA
jgi:anhydro-N-acetylmuramic acid kinase